MTRITQFWVWFLPLAYMALIYAISSISIPAIHVPMHTDKVIHFLEYGVLALFLYYALRNHLSSRVLWLLVPLLSALYGVTDEIHQAFIPGRDCSLNDWIADLLGSSVMTLLLYTIASRLEYGTEKNSHL